MANNKQPVLKRCATLNISPMVMGISKETHRKPQKNMHKKQSEYAIQLNEKQKLKFIYGVLEKQFYHYYLLAEKKAGLTGENLLKILESRIDNVVYRLGYASTRREARQLVGHGHFLVNGHKVDIPSYLVKEGDVISVKEKSRSSVKFKALMEMNAKSIVPKWLEKDAEHFSGKVIGTPDKESLDYDVQEHLIVELYSK